MSGTLQQIGNILFVFVRERGNHFLLVLKVAINESDTDSGFGADVVHVDDLASACLFLIQNYDSAEIINIGTGTDLTIRELAELICEVVGFRGELTWDKSKPDGTPRKLLDISKIESLGWKPTIPLREGIARTYDWFKEQGRYQACGAP